MGGRLPHAPAVGRAGPTPLITLPLPAPSPPRPASLSPPPPARAPPRRFLLVATDSPRLLVLGAADGRPLAAFHGLPHDPFHTPSLAWHRDGRHVVVGAAGAQLVFVHAGGWVKGKGGLGQVLLWLLKLRFWCGWGGVAVRLAAGQGSRPSKPPPAPTAGTCKVAAQVASAHRINVRDLSYDATTNRLATCSFDKTVKCWTPAATA